MLIFGINHITLKVRDLEASDWFYREILELKQVGQRKGMRFYSTGAHHHDLALLQAGTNAISPPVHQTGLAHFCLNVVDDVALDTLYRKCRDAKITLSGGVSHVVMRGFYALDPDAHVVELGVDMPLDSWKDSSNPYANDIPFQFVYAQDD